MPAGGEEEETEIREKTYRVCRNIINTCQMLLHIPQVGDPAPPLNHAFFSCMRNCSLRWRGVSRILLGAAASTPSITAGQFPLPYQYVTLRPI